jgi:hypothetical protein
LLSVLAGVTLLLPGACWWVWCGRHDEDGIEILAKILGVSIAFQALAALLLYLLNISLTLGWLIGLHALFLGLIIWGIFRKRDIRANWSWLAAILVFAVFLAWRLYQAQALVLPAWVDSLHHVLIVRKMLEVGGLPADLSPYLQGPFYYHYAFHASAASFAALSGLAPAQAVLVWGQVVSAGVGLSAYSLGKALFKDWRPAILAALLVTFATKMPAYYLSWGRYTLLTGMLLLPLAIAAAIQMLEGSKKRLDWLGVTLLTAGTLLAHYFTAVLLAFFLLMFGSWHLLDGWQNKKLDWKALLDLTLAVLTGLLLALPWLLRVFAHTGMTMTPELNLPQEPNGYFQNKDQWQYLWYLLGPPSGYILLGLAVPGLIAAFSRKGWRAFASWALVLMLLALPWGLRLGSFRYDHFAIVLFLPICLLAAGMLEWLAVRFGSLLSRPWIGKMVFGLLGLGIVIWGGFQTKDTINDGTVLASKADLAALEWIDVNLPKEARFFINTTGWGYDISRGVDGGAWILPVTGRWSLAPTIFYPFGQESDYIDQLNDWGVRAQTITGCDGAFWQLVDEAELTHVYLREGKGSLQAGALEGCEGAEKLYEVDGVSLWGLGK